MVSPKSHSHELTFPVERSVKVTVSGSAPLSGVAEKSAVGGVPWALTSAGTEMNAGSRMEATSSNAVAAEIRRLLAEPTLLVFLMIEFTGLRLFLRTNSSIDSSLMTDAGYSCSSDALVSRCRGAGSLLGIASSYCG